jgi:uncharacterized protein YciI
MLFALICRDKPGSLDTRLSNRPAHVDYLAANAEIFVYAGPLLGADGETPVGSLLVIDVADRAAAEAFAAGDPYAKADLFADVEISATRQVFPKT